MHLVRANGYSFLFSALDSWADEEKVYIVMPPMKETLYERLQRGDTISYPQSKRYMAELIIALRVLHTKLGIVHGNITVENIYFDHNGHVYLGGFDTVSVCPNDDFKKYNTGDPSSQAHGILEHMAADVRNLANVFYQLAMDEADVSERLDLDELENKDFKEVIEHMLSSDPAERCTTNELWQHPIFISEDFTEVILLAKSQMLPFPGQRKIAVSNKPYQPPIAGYCYDRSKGFPRDDRFEKWKLKEEDQEMFKRLGGPQVAGGCVPL